MERLTESMDVPERVYVLMIQVYTRGVLIEKSLTSAYIESHGNICCNAKNLAK